MTDAGATNGTLPISADDDTFVKDNDINFDEAQKMRQDNPKNRYLTFRQMYNYRKFLEDKFLSGSNKKLKLPTELRALFRKYEFYGFHPTNKNLKGEVRNNYIKNAISRGEKPVAKQNSKVSYNYNTASIKDIIEIDAVIEKCSKYTKLGVVRYIVIPHMARIFEFIFKREKEALSLEALSSQNQKTVSDTAMKKYIDFIELSEYRHTPTTQIAKHIASLRKKTIDWMRRKYILNIERVYKNKNLNKNLHSKIIEIIKIPKNDPVSRRVFKNELTRKYKNISNSPDINRLINLIKVKSIIETENAFKFLNFPSKDFNNVKKNIKNNTITALKRIITDTKKKYEFKGDEKLIENLVDKTLKMYKQTNILTSSEKSELDQLIKNITISSKKNKEQKDKVNKERLYKSLIKRIQANQPVDLKNYKNVFKGNKGYIINLQTEINKKKFKTGNIPFKIYNQIKNEQIKKYKKDGTPYPLNYFKSRYGYTNEQLKILNSEYVNKLDDMYNEIDSTIIKKLFIIERKYYEGKIKAILTLLRTRNQESYDKMNTSVKEDLSKGVDSLKKEYGNKFISELRKRKPKEMAKLAKKIAVYARKYKQIYRAASLKIRRMEQQQQKRLSLSRATRAKKTRI